MNDLISVIVPIYNVEQYLSQCINSIINQTYSNIEIILLDDGSTDNSLNIIKEYASQDKRIKYYSRENKGLLYTRIDGVEKARGKYITFVDSDDWLELNAIEILYHKIIKYKADMLKSSYKIVDGNKKTNVYRKDEDTIYNGKEIKNMYIDMINTYIFNPVWSQLIKTEIIKKYIKNSDYSISMGEDVEINMQLLDKYKTIVVTSDILYNYRYNPNSISKKASFEKTKDRIKDLLKTYYNFSEFIYKNCEDLYNKSLEKSIYVINDNLMCLANIDNLKYNETVIYIKSVINQDFIKKIIENTDYKKIKTKRYIEKLFLKNLYNKNCKIYVIELIILSKLKIIKRMIKKW
jgi:glycosyltransferase involved in cell wall biosynthesis